MNNLKWNPQKITLIRIKNKSNPKLAYKSFRNTSSSFISKKEIREYVFNKYKRCNICNSKELLEIDHIKSVLICFKNNQFEECNSLENLQLLCKKCNTSKNPL